LQFGLDFTGGTQIELGYDEPVALEDVRGKLSSAGFDGAVVVHFGSESEVLIRLQQDNDPKLSEAIVTALQNDSAVDFELRRVEFVGPQVGEELRDDGGLGMLFALLVVMMYVAMRFQYKFSVGAVAALVHDVILVLGFFSVMAIDFDLTVLAAVLAVIGYSLNDTIVVADRIRENFRKLRKGDSLEIINVSLTQTLGRTLITSLTTILVLLALFIFGGELIHGFASALLVGVVVGTYSSIYVSANVLLMLDIDREDLMIPVKEGAEFDEEHP
jgi:preprotein translocase subunit SecF